MKKILSAIVLAVFAGSLPVWAQITNTAGAAPMPSLPNASLSVLRVFGALALVMGIFLGGVWMFRNWQRLARQHGRQPRLNILESRSLGGRQAIFVVGYQQQRFLVSSSPSGVSLLSHLPDAVEEPPPEGLVEKNPPPFPLLLARILKGK